MIERKCLKCQTWNKDEKHCTNCGNLMRYEDVMQEKEKAKIKAEEEREKDKFELLLERMRNHRFLAVRIGYKILYSISILLGAFGAFMAWLVAMANG
ncbi:MAG: hypothetical protein MI810_14190 [Flavobacteriales bacterium]|nr:hypothetical protein [Flavobacteriales bacterium]